MARYLSKNSSAKQQLLEIISSLVRDDRAARQAGQAVDNRLPSESELSHRIGLSVSTIREALRTLEMEGYISKKHGMGNYYHASTLESRMRIDTIMDFSDLLADAGLQVTVSQSDLMSIPKDYPAGTPFERQLSASLGSLMRYDRMYLADGRTAIATRNYIPASSIDTREGTVTPRENLIDFLWFNCSKQVTHSIELMTPEIADEAERRLFELPENTPLIRWSETFYSYDDEAVGYAEVAFNPTLIGMRLLRKWS